MDSQLPMWLGPPTKWAAKSTGPEIGAGLGAGCARGRLFVCSGVVGTSSLQGALVPCGGWGGAGCHRPGQLTAPSGLATPLAISPHLSSWALGPEDSTLSEGVQLGSRADRRLHPAVHGCAEPGPPLPALRSCCHSALCLSFPIPVTPPVSTPRSTIIGPTGSRPLDQEAGGAEDQKESPWWWLSSP